ncbi:hypothetical protein, partial [Falsiroseomonas sp. HW251]|uniref:hypothetical protein n=1 Tax=Falsiroseomonas sp. HW251 TaxID=3390998 RepID=UPI003D314074
HRRIRTGLTARCFNHGGSVEQSRGSRVVLGKFQAVEGDLGSSAVISVMSSSAVNGLCGSGKSLSATRLSVV